MADLSNPRVAVYIDFDNIVVSRYNQLFGRAAWTNDSARNFAMAGTGDGVAKKLDQARVDVGAILDYASSFGSIVVNRAYADWSAPANASYSRQLIDRAVDLTQLFNTAGTKNGADIRLAVDVVDDLFRLADITHVVIVAGDSDYIALAQRCKRLGRFVVGIGVAGATSRALVAACDEFTDYDEIPGVPKPEVEPVGEQTKRTRGTGGRVAATPRIETNTPPEPESPKGNSPTFSHAASDSLDDQAEATDLLRRALQLIDAKNDEEWQTNGEVKSQMIRLNPAFKEKSIGFKSFTDFLNSRNGDVIEILPKSKANDRRLKLL
ncbi:NYN domain-containing protein [soil metagenome]